MVCGNLDSNVSSDSWSGRIYLVGVGALEVKNVKHGLAGEDGGDERVDKPSRAHYDIVLSNVRSARMIA